MASFLVVEDDLALGNLLTRILAYHGEASLASSVSEGLALFVGRQPVDALVVDVSLPDGSGLHLAADARAIVTDLPVLVVSGTVDAERLVKAQAVGAQFLLKPVETDQLDLFARRVLAREFAAENRLRNAVDAWAGHHRLTRSESAILELAARGAASGDIALVRHVTKATVKKQVQLLLSKTGDPSLAAAANRVLRDALLH